MMSWVLIKKKPPDRQRRDPEKNYKYPARQFFNFAVGSYLERTSRPVYAIVFLLPFIVFSELGTLFINTDILNQSQGRVVAFVWLQNFLEYAGISSRLAWAAPPIAVIIILMSLQLVSRKRWNFRLGDIGPTALECILLAVPLIVLSLFLNSSAPGQAAVKSQVVPAPVHLCAGVFSSSDSRTDKLFLCSAITDKTAPVAEHRHTGPRFLLADVVTGVGAGIYEELVFRLILISLLMLLFQDVLRLNHKDSVILSVLISAALFSAHHHVAFVNGRLVLGTPFNLTEFGFRTVAGIYFAGLFALRGFAVAAGTHAFYDIIATTVNAVFFQQ